MVTAASRLPQSALRLTSMGSSAGASRRTVTLAGSPFTTGLGATLSEMAVGVWALATMSSVWVSVFWPSVALIWTPDMASPPASKATSASRVSLAISTDDASRVIPSPAVS